MAQKNIFVVIEGLDGSGKSTIAKMLSEAFDCYYYETPAGYYKQIRTLVDNGLDIIEHYLFYLAAVRYASQQIQSMLKQRSVICDRYIYSTLAYHRTLGLGITINIDELQLLMPDYVFYLQISEEIQLQRLKERGYQTTTADNWLVKQNLFNQLDREFKKFPVRLVDAGHKQPKQIITEIIDDIGKEP